MFSFSYRSFRNHLRSPLEQSEINFLIRTFAFSAIYFLLFGIFISCVHWITFKLFGASLPFYFALTFLGVLIYFPLSFFSLKYRNNPLRVPTSFVMTSFLILTLTFVFIFLGLAGTLGHAVLGGSEIQKRPDYVVWTVLGVFGITYFIYLIPAIMAIFIRNRRTAMTLNRFLNFCYFIYIALFVIFLLIALLGFQISGVFPIILCLLVIFILFLSPILTVYRMKTVAHYINYEDPFERKRWENYFTFEITFQLLQLAACLLRIIIMFVHSGSRTRLR